MSNQFTTINNGDLVQPLHINQFIQSLNDLESGKALYREGSLSGSNYIVNFQTAANPGGHFLSGPLTAGQIVIFKAMSASPANAQLQVQLQGGSTATAPLTVAGVQVGSGQILANQIVMAVYNNSPVRFDVVGLGGSGGLTGSGSTNRMTFWSGTNTLSSDAGITRNGSVLNCANVVSGTIPIYSSSGAVLYAYTSGGSKGQHHHWSSSRLFKRNIRPMERIKEQLQQLEPVRYDGTVPALNSESELTESEVEEAQYQGAFGLIAEDVKELFPDLTYEIPLPDGSTTIGVHYDRLPIYNLQALKEQQDEIAELKARLAALERGQQAT